MVNSPSAGRSSVNVIVLLICASPFTMCVRFLLAGSVIFSVQVPPCYRSVFSAPIPSPGSCRPVQKAAAYSAPCRYTCGCFSVRRCPAAGSPVECVVLRCRIAAQKIRHPMPKKSTAVLPFSFIRVRTALLKVSSSSFVLGSVSVLGQLEILLHKGVMDGFQLGMDGGSVLDLGDCPHTVFVPLQLPAERGGGLV